MGAATATATATRRAIGIVRVSQVHGRAGESFAGPPEQRDRIAAACDRDGLRLLEVLEELDVSGGTPLAERKGLRAAVEAIEAGHADVIVVAYFDRLVRSLRVQTELIERVEAAGGQILAVDVGQISNGSASQWLNGTMHGMMAEYVRRSAKERSAGYQQRSIDRRVPPWPNVTPGYMQTRGEPYQVDPAAAPIVREAFELRADGGTINEVRAFLAQNGIKLSYHGVIGLLASPAVLGEIHFGHYTPNLHAHPAIVDRDLWNRVQRIKVSRGRRAKSDRLLARLGVLRCGTCGARMVVGTSNNSSYYLYRCPPNGDCTRRVTISADLVEKTVLDAVKAALADSEGRASVADHAREAEAEAARAQDELDTAIRGFEVVRDEPAAVERLAELATARDAAVERAEHLRGPSQVVKISAVRDWDRLLLEERRALVRAVVDRVEVAPGRGADRITVKLVSE
jgi:DNA invertase Pin-like site-specific DNA recombinase